MGDNANSNFEFIKEQVVEKKRKILKKRFLRLLSTLFTAVLFGFAAAVTFALAEPPVYNFVHRDGKGKGQISLPTASNSLENADNAEISGTPESEGMAEIDESSAENRGVVSETVIKKIDADLSDYKDMYYELRKVAYKVKKSIVEVNSTFLVEDWFNNVVEKNVSTTGIIVAETPVNYYILVSLDRVQGADKIRLKFFDTVYVDAWLIDYEEEINIAIISATKEDIPSIYLSGLDTAIIGENYSLVVGNPVIALGSPNGHINSMGIGIITSEGSSVSITDNIIKLFNTDIDDCPDSDGVIVNMRGEIIGLITRTLKNDQNKEINTAISIEYIRPYIIRMINQNRRVYFGIKAKDMTEDAKQEHEVRNGIYVDEVFTDSPAYKGNIKNGDIIITVNGSEVMNTNNFYTIISRYEPGTQLDVKVKRKNGNYDKLMDLLVILSNKPQ